MGAGWSRLVGHSADRRGSVSSSSVILSDDLCAEIAMVLRVTPIGNERKDANC